MPLLLSKEFVNIYWDKQRKIENWSVLLLDKKMHLYFKYCLISLNYQSNGKSQNEMMILPKQIAIIIKGVSWKATSWCRLLKFFPPP